MTMEYHDAWLYLVHREQVKQLDTSQVQRLALVSVAMTLNKFRMTFLSENFPSLSPQNPLMVMDSKILGN